MLCCTLFQRIDYPHDSSNFHWHHANSQHWIQAFPVAKSYSIPDTLSSIMQGGRELKFGPNREIIAQLVLVSADSKSTPHLYVGMRHLLRKTRRILTGNASSSDLPKRSSSSGSKHKWHHRESKALNTTIDLLKRL